jgi:flagellar motor protein MotB
MMMRLASGPIADNWDLSTERATAIVAILSENKKSTNKIYCGRKRRIHWEAMQQPKESEKSESK